MDNQNVPTKLEYAHYSKKILNNFWLKMIGFLFTLIDHIGLLFQAQIGETAATILRCIGRLAFPLFILMAVEGVYYTKNYWKYFIRLFSMALILDIFAYICHYAMNLTEISPGNIFMDLALGTLIIYLFRLNNPFTLFSIPVMGYIVLSDFSFYKPNGSLPLYGISTDYGTYGLCLLLAFYFGYEIVIKSLKKYCEKNSFDYETIANEKLRLYLNLVTILMLFFVCALFTVFDQLINLNLPIIPSLGMSIESWSCLAFIFILLYDGRPGTKNKIARYSMYGFYPLHLLILGLIYISI